MIKNTVDGTAEDQNCNRRNQTLSIVIPVFNEALNLPILFESLLANLQEVGHPFEVILVNDGSTDSSEKLLASMASRDQRIKVINFRRNYGQTAAMMAGMDFASG